MKPLVALFFCCLAIHLPLAAQPFIDWQTIYGMPATDHSINDIIANPDGSYMAIGEISGTQTLTDYDLLLLKITATGDTLWSQAIGEANEDKGYALVATNDNAYVIAGTTNSITGMFANTHGLHDAWILKVADTGEIIWSYTWGGSGEEQIFDITSDNSGNYYVAGYSESTDYEINNKGFTDGYILKINDVGELVWQQTYGGTSFDRLRAITFDPSTQLLLAAGSTASIDFDLADTTPKGGNDVWVIKIDPSTSALSSSYRYGGSLNDVAMAMTKTADGGVALIGDSLSSDGDLTQNFGTDDWWIFKIDFMGSLQWQRSVGQQAYDNARTLVATPDGHLIATGHTFDPDLPPPNYFFDIRVLKLRQDNGNIAWQGRYGGSQYEFGNAVALSNNGNGIVVAGATDSTDGDVGTNGGGMQHPNLPSGNVRHGSHRAWIFHLDEIMVNTPPINPNGMNSTVYPNPTNDKVTLNISHNKPLNNATISIYNTNGQIIAQQLINTNDYATTIELNTHHYPQGLYSVLVQLGDKTAYRHKIIIAQ